MVIQSATNNPWLISEVDILIRLFLALLLGGLIGLEREQSNHAAGLRTNILVCLGACLLMLLSIYGFSDFVEEPNVRVDPARLAAAVITGVGFLGAGTILFTGKSITGLTTAASLWVVAAIGLAVGAGFYFASVSVTVMALLTLWLFNKLEKRFITSKKEHIIKIHAVDLSLVMINLNGIIDKRHIVIRKMFVEDVELNEKVGSGHSEEQALTRLVLYITMPNRKDETMIKLLNELKKLEGIRWVSSE
ncbi:MgtC/SapB family protein [Paenibacillus sp. GSMTC-2017]|uniref:MgtC/SapB family protein n=1 Tax=Paenibacillus sp. GSMTC-2017 TaxID=2794350 RepID=UPI0018D920E9|nr:MgtC/SapB family protein [Paenibacillus sp. GSMTC-2017]MBH5320235.1 MgtC/SapB family protein [Paenibacillus sp. GSMTC-2017]